MPDLRSDRLRAAALDHTDAVRDHYRHTHGAHSLQSLPHSLCPVPLNNRPFSHTARQGGMRQSFSVHWLLYRLVQKSLSRGAIKTFFIVRITGKG